MNTIPPSSLDVKDIFPPPETLDTFFTTVHILCSAENQYEDEQISLEYFQEICPILSRYIGYVEMYRRDRCLLEDTEEQFRILEEK